MARPHAHPLSAPGWAWRVRGERGGDGSARVERPKDGPERPDPDKATKPADASRASSTRPLCPLPPLSSPSSLLPPLCPPPSPFSPLSPLLSARPSRPCGPRRPRPPAAGPQEVGFLPCSVTGRCRAWTEPTLSIDDLASPCCVGRFLSPRGSRRARGPRRPSWPRARSRSPTPTR